MAVVTLAEAKTHLNITVTTYDTELGEFIDRAQAACESYIGGPIPSTAFTESVDGGGEALVLRRLPIVSVSSVVVDGTTASSGTYTVDNDAGIIYYGASTSPGLTWSHGRRNITVTYNAGRSTVPDDVLQAVLEMLRHLWTTQRGAMSARNPLGGDEYAGTGWSLPRRVMELLEPYRIAGIA